jgi:hypothetical protein
MFSIAKGEEINQKLRIYNRAFDKFTKIYKFGENDEISCDYVESDRNQENLIEFCFSLTSDKMPNKILDQCLTYMNKLHSFNFHLIFTVSIFNQNIKEYESLIDFHNFSLLIPLFDEIPKYLEHRFSQIITDDYCYMFTKNYSEGEIKLMVLFHNFDQSGNYLDTIIYKNREFTRQSEKASKMLFQSEEFTKVLLDYFGITVLDSKDIHKVKIKSDNNKSLILIASLNNYNLNYLIRDLIDMLKSAKQIIKEKNMLLLLNKTERESIQIYERDYAIISKSLIEVMKYVS